MFLEGIGISGYRSFGPEVQRFGPLKKINLIIGANNSGKSNFLSFLRYQYQNLTKSESPKVEELDSHIGDTRTEYDYEIALKIDGDLYRNFIEKISSQRKNLFEVIDLIRKLFTSEAITGNTTTIWFPLVSTGGRLIPNKNVFINNRILTNDEWRHLWNVLSGYTGGGLLENWIPETLNILNPIKILNKSVFFIPAIREIVAGEGAESIHVLMSGRGIVKQLAKLKKPRYNQPHLKAQFENINHFLQTVTGNNSAKIEIPSEQDIIQVSINGRTLPLSSLGTGIHEVIILASASTIIQDQIICIEEPEIHLHPLLQKKLLAYLSENTNNQYFIATHSAHLLDMPDVSIFHIKLEKGISVVDIALTNSHKSLICDELGYKASDLLQSNCIIWVEGPSDRIYLNHWIHSKDNNLVEGIHYSIMFYGGRLLSHLSANDEEVNDFISLRRLNRHLGIVIDSDKRNAKDDINDTKKRVKLEFENSSDFVWLTQGKEIENYIDPELINKALKEIYGPKCHVVEYSEFNSCIGYRKEREKEFKAADKVKLAHCVVSNEAKFTVLDLNEKINALVKYIRLANGMDK